jgi:hypothetical protein
VGQISVGVDNLTENYLPKAAIDKTTFRMSELLKQRFVTRQSAPETKRADVGEQDEQA